MVILLLCGLCVVGAATLVVLYAVTVVATWLLTERSVRHLPQGPQPTLLLGNIPDIIKCGGLYYFVKIYGAKYDSFTMFLGSNPVYMTKDPEQVKVACLKQTKHFPHRTPDHRNPLILGQYGLEYYGSSQILILSTNSSWKSVRAALSSIFTSANLIKFVPQLQDNAQKVTRCLLDGGQSGKEVNVHKVLGQMTICNVALAAFGVEIETIDKVYSNDTQEGALPGGKTKLIEAFKTVFSVQTGGASFVKMCMLLPTWLQPYATVLPFQLHAMFPGELQTLRDARRYLHNASLAMVNRTRREMGHRVKYPAPDDYAVGTPAQGSLIHMLAATRNNDTNEPFDDVAIAYHAMTFLLAGYDTTANSISFTLYLLGQHMDCQERAAKECASLQVEQINSLEDLEAALPYTYACYNEALRLYPTVFFGTRLATRDVQIGEHLIPKGCALGFNIVAMHYDAKYFSDPTKYNPDRFLPGNPERESRPQNTFLPFGLGPRNCIGYRFAILQSLLCLATLLAEAKVVLHETRIDEVLRFNRAITLGPKDGIWLKVQPR